MSVRRIVPLAAIGLVMAGALVPAQAGSPKFAGTYKVTLQPDPSPNAFHAAGMDQCMNLNAKAVDRHALVVPAAGKFKVILDSPDPTGRGVTDWDMYAVSKDGKTLASSTGATSHEEITLKLTAKTDLSIVVCNQVGAMDGTVSYTLK